ncbi:S-layer homology domain-containing protein [Paenibacillus sophorae]|uniref:S-layer homology domain-containing protein n=1 Tax=Paenibacillus sophorae TaxID=1333845 RepID=A0A1H8IAK6_9BACL|nr:S-layer homology domain-containing protein [Paenibacillus sophorae]QWU15886.1 S-layer homology domain-containing protein [Paenibacillus sophorae]SEN64858.1 S-layer homology domain-containing protein [Paenibacillus sophorae]
MKNRIRSMGSFILAVVILLSTLSATGAAYAAAGQYFTFTKFSTSQSSPTIVNTGEVDVEGTFNGVSPDSIYYKVDSIVNGTEVPGASGTDVKPNITNEKYFTFPNVKLSQGLNRITIYGVTSDGSLASGEAFVNFSNVPAIYNIALPDGTLLSEGQPTIVNTSGLTLTLEAPNASEVMINSSKMYNGGSTTFVIADYPLSVGLNKLTFVSTTDGGTRTYSVTRDVIYAPVGSGTPHNTKIGSAAVDTGNVVTAASGKLSGSVTFKVPDSSSVPNLTTLTYTIRNTTTGNDVVSGATATVTKTSSTGSFITFDYISAADVPALSVNGAYTIIFNGTYDGKSITPVKFDFRDAATAYIKDIQQIYSPSVSGTTVTYMSSGAFSDNSSLFQLPLWLLVKTSKTDGTTLSNLSITTYQNGSPVTSSAFSTNSYVTSDGYRVYQINGLPTGEQTLHIDLKSGSTIVDSKTFTINYISAPYIELTNLYNNQVFKNSGDFTAVTGQLVNFPTGDLGSAKITINGSTSTLPMNVSANKFSFGTSGNQLVSGPNKITVTGTANGVPVSTSVTVYLFPDNLPSLAGLVPLPLNQTSDPDQLFVKTADLQYTTNQISADIQFVTSNADQVIIMVDGAQKAVANWNGSSWTYAPSTVNLLVPNTNQGGTFTLRGQSLPTTGLRTITVTARLQTSTVSQTLQITREVPPYSILSPKLPNESVIKQNFLDVSIQAEGADSIVIGKTAMVKGERDIFRTELKGLKKGLNTIKFTITTGTQKTNGSFSVTYSDEVLQGAQLKTALNGSGKLSAFQNAVTLNFPKGTLLRDATPAPGTTNTRQINLFNDQYILLGIADKQDGRTVKQYNPVGETDSSGNFQDGKLKEVSANSLATTYLTPKLHYGYASNLYWIDPGYFVTNTSINDYDTVISSHPYKTGNEFYLGHMGKWLEPTQQGTITLKYDSNLANAATSNISVWKNVDGTWYNMGGKINTSSKTITATFDGFGYYAVMNLRYSYDDIVSHPYARSELETMMAKGIMNAKDSSEFGVYENITRGEFATMLVKIMGTQLDYEPDKLTFSDVVKYSDYHWDYRYIETAVRKGIIKGTAPRLFSPNSTLSREDATVMIARAMNLKLGTVDKDSAALLKLFTDTGSIESSYSIPSILAVYKAGIVSGIANKLVAGQNKVTYRFDPQAKFTRADGAVMAQRMMVKMKKL